MTINLFKRQVIIHGVQNITTYRIKTEFDLIVINFEYNINVGLTNPPVIVVFFRFCNIGFNLYYRRKK